MPAEVLAEAPDVGCLKTLRTLVHLELDLLVLLEVAVPAALDGTEMHENVGSAVLGDEAVPLLRVEPFHRSCGHKQSLLSWPYRTSFPLRDTGPEASGVAGEGFCFN